MWDRHSRLLEIVHFLMSPIAGARVPEKRHSGASGDQLHVGPALGRTRADTPPTRGHEIRSSEVDEMALAGNLVPC